MPAHPALFWLAFALLAPLMLVQAAWTQSRARRLPVADGVHEGEVPGMNEAGTGEPLRILFVGESPVAGVGVAHMDESVAARTAHALAQRTGRPVHWHAAGINGIRIGQALEHLLPRLPDARYDAIVAVHGVNDTTALTTLTEWRRLLVRLADALHERHGGQVYFTQVPPMHLFTALPQPLRAVIGARAKILDRALHDHPLHGARFEVIDADFPLDPDYLAEDGYHPSAKGVAAWSRQIANALRVG